MSPKAAGLAAKMGFTNVKVMLEGVPAWKKSGQMMSASNQFVVEGNHVLIDLRSEEEAAAGHIARAVNIPLAELTDAEDDFPNSKTAPIVLYGNGDDARKAAKIIKGWGFKTISVVDGGLAGWQKAGNIMEKGPAGSEISWTRIMGPGEVSIADFQKAAAGEAAGQMILDVRTTDEIEAGRFSNSIHIPLDEIEARLAELPKDKEFLAHCSTGARAEMAISTLKKHNISARFLVAEVECEEGSCEIAE
jgi:rhodanese-related sulfurtransferase